MAKVRGIANWAWVQSPNTTYEPVYCGLTGLCRKTRLYFERSWLDGSRRLTRGFVCKFKRKQFKADGTRTRNLLLYLLIRVHSMVWSANGLRGYYSVQIPI